MNVRKQLTIVAPDRATLAVVLTAGLAARGWSIVSTSPDRARYATDQAGLLVIVEDDDGRAWMPLPAATVRHGFVAVGSVRSLTVLIPLASRGATVLNQAAPILLLISLIETALTAPEALIAGQYADLLRRQDEVTGLSRLTRAEAQVLGRLVDGIPAGRIADESRHSIHTVRSQIKSVLAKLAVTNQLAAVAIVHRSGPTQARESARATFTNFGDDPVDHSAEH